MAKGKQKQEQSGRNQSAGQNSAQNRNPNQSGENAKTAPGAK
jgi:hypothetical protein